MTTFPPSGDRDYCEEICSTGIDNIDWQVQLVMNPFKINPNEEDIQKTAKTIIQTLKSIFTALPKVAELAEAAKTLIRLVPKYFGF